MPHKKGRTPPKTRSAAKICFSAGLLVQLRRGEALAEHLAGLGDHHKGVGVHCMGRVAHLEYLRLAAGTQNKMPLNARIRTDGLDKRCTPARFLIDLLRSGIAVGGDDDGQLAAAAP